MASINMDPLSVDEPTGGEEEEEEEEEERGAEWSRDTQVPVKQLAAHREAVNAARLCFNDSFLLTCSSDATAVLWDVESCLLRRLFSGVHGKPVTELAVIPNSNSASADGRLLVCAADPQNSVNVSDAASGRTLHHVSDHHCSTITRCRFDPQSQRVATVSADRRIRLWDLLALKTTVSINSNHGNVISHCCFTNNGRFLCSASWDKTLKLWDVQTGGFRSHGGAALQGGHEGSVSTCCFSADANLLVSGSYDRTVALWDMSTLCQTLILKGHSDWVTDVSISADRTLVSSASKDGTVRLWNIKNMEEIPEVLEKRRTEGAGTDILQCEECGKAFPVSSLQTSELLTRCVFCRLRSPSRYRPQPPPVI
ncbi:hypothetical protein PAMA_000915 [Pampus argenteus]